MWYAALKMALNLSWEAIVQLTAEKEVEEKVEQIAKHL